MMTKLIHCRRIERSASPRSWPPRLSRPLVLMVLCGIGFILHARSSPAQNLASTPYMGWSTEYCLTNFTDQDIRAVAQAMVQSGLRDAGYKFIWLDVGWWKGKRDAEGHILPDPGVWPARFPDDVDYLHSLGFKVGVVTDAGKSGCAGADEGSEGNYQKDVDILAAWGIDAIKLDFCSSGSDNLDPKTVATQFADAIDHNSSGRKILFDVAYVASGTANTSWQWAPAIADSWRTSDAVDGWNGLINAITDNARHPEVVRAGHWNDPDYIIPMEHSLTVPESRAQFSLWAEMAAPLVISCEVRTMPDELRKIILNNEIIAVDQDPRGVQGIPVAENNPGEQIWVKRLSGSGRRAVVVFNRTEIRTPITVPYAALGLASPVKIRDLWSHDDLGTFKRDYVVTLEPHSVAMYLMTGADLPFGAVPNTDITVTASSFHPGLEPKNVMDGNPKTIWQAEWAPAHDLPQFITLALRKPYKVKRLIYTPRSDGSQDGMINMFKVLVSQDGKNFTPIVDGLWEADGEVKTAVFDPVEARYVRLEVDSGMNGYASAAEIGLQCVPEKPHS